MDYGLQLSQLEELWPGAKTPPENSIGMLWCACRKFGAAALRFHHAENVHNMLSQKSLNVVSPVKRSVHSQPKETSKVVKKVVPVLQKSRMSPLLKDYLPLKIPRHKALRKVVRRRVLRIGVVVKLT